LFIDINNIFNISNIISMVTKTIDSFVVLIIGISAIQIIIPIIISLIKINKKEKNNNFAIKSFINSLLLALELESANAILKMGLFVSNATDTMSNNSIALSNNFNNFVFFVAVLSVRIIINQTLRRYSIGKTQQ
jgi:hypothetical protein